jgi:hypothetical protein
VLIPVRHPGQRVASAVTKKEQQCRSLAKTHRLTDLNHVVKDHRTIPNHHHVVRQRKRCQHRQMLKIRRAGKCIETIDRVKASGAVICDFPASPPVAAIQQSPVERPIDQRNNPAPATMIGRSERKAEGKICKTASIPASVPRWTNRTQSAAKHT